MARKPNSTLTLVLSAALLFVSALACSRQTEPIPADAAPPAPAASATAPEATPATEPAVGTLTVTLDVEHMHCQYCENNIDTALAALDGVLSSRSDRTKKQTVVTLDPAKTTPEAVAAAVKTAPGMSGKPGQYSATVAAR